MHATGNGGGAGVGWLRDAGCAVHLVSSRVIVHAIGNARRLRAVPPTSSLSSTAADARIAPSVPAALPQRDVLRGGAQPHCRGTAAA
jgi:hypothetical protein